MIDDWPAKLAEIQSVTQLGVPAPELEIFAHDVQDTAAAILNLDVVISVDTMTAHLASFWGVRVDPSSCACRLALDARAR